MTRNHIHLAQGVADAGVVSGRLLFSHLPKVSFNSLVLQGMRKSSQVLVFIDLERALRAGLKFFVSSNGVVLTEGDERGYIKPEFFKRVERANRQPIRGWERPGTRDVSPKPRLESSFPENTTGAAEVGIPPEVSAAVNL
jgi:2'-phosphotransferase